MFERFTDRARRVLVLAQGEAHLLGHDSLGTEHLLLGLVHEQDGIGARVLTGMGLSLDQLRAEVQAAVGPATGKATGSIPFSPRAKKVLELSLRQALALGHNYIGTEHLLLGLVEEGQGVAARVLAARSVDLEVVREAVIQAVNEHTMGTRLALADLDELAGAGAEVAMSPAEVVTAADVSDVVGPTLQVRQSVVDSLALGDRRFESCSFTTLAHPKVTVTVLGRGATADGFGRYLAGHPEVTAITDGPGEAAAFHAASATLLVLQAGTVFTVRVEGADPLPVTRELGRRGAARLARLQGGDRAGQEE